MHGVRRPPKTPRLFVLYSARSEILRHSSCAKNVYQLLPQLFPGLHVLQTTVRLFFAHRAAMGKQVGPFMGILLMVVKLFFSIAAEGIPEAAGADREMRQCICSRGRRRTSRPLIPMNATAGPSHSPREGLLISGRSEWPSSGLPLWPWLGSDGQTAKIDQRGIDMD